REVLPVDGARPARARRRNGVLEARRGRRDQGDADRVNLPSNERSRAMRHLFATMCRRLKAVVLRRRLERDLDDEVAFHLAMRQADLAAAGMTTAAAREAARRRFGNVTHFKEQMRDMWIVPTIEHIWQDVKYAG